MAALERILEDNRKRELFLETAQCSLPEDDFQRLVGAREWPKRIRVILNVHQRRIQEEYDHYEAALKKKRSEFIHLLEKYESYPSYMIECLNLAQSKLVFKQDNDND